MTKEEIKETYSMKNILSRYGMAPNRSGFIRCPFHAGDNQASLKVYDRDFNCFACGANGDIFTFVQMMEQVSFREAYQILGGTYEKPSFSSRIAIYRAQKRREMDGKKQARRKQQRELNSLLISVYRRWSGRLEPLSDGWCNCQNRLQYQLYLYDELRGDGNGAA